MDVLVLEWANIGLVKKEIKFWRIYLEIGYISIYKTPHIKYEFLNIKIKITFIKVFFYARITVENLMKNGGKDK